MGSDCNCAQPSCEHLYDGISSRAAPLILDCAESTLLPFQGGDVGSQVKTPIPSDSAVFVTLDSSRGATVVAVSDTRGQSVLSEGMTLALHGPVTVSLLASDRTSQVALRWGSTPVRSETSAFRVLTKALKTITAASSPTLATQVLSIQQGLSPIAAIAYCPAVGSLNFAPILDPGNGVFTLGTTVSTALAAATATKVVPALDRGSYLVWVESAVANQDAFVRIHQPLRA